ncbi:MAG TPA: ABC transporter substrate-binding protein [Acidimicrobiales bacterium]|nr:ABC transporter substrate-binding protein [Acidimicrobiales bacterium]
MSSLVLPLALGGAIAGTTVAGAAKLKPLVIASIGNYSGGGTTSASAGAKVAITAWAKWVNAHGGVAGHQVKLIIKDDASTAAASVSDVKKLVQTDHVIAFVMAFDSATESGWSSYVDNAKVPVVGGDLDTPTWITKPMFFPEGTTVDKLIAGGMYAAHKSGAKKAGFIVCSNIAACQQAATLAKTTAAKYTVTYVYTGLVLPGSANYTSTCLAAKTSGAQAIGFGIAPDTGIRVATDCATQGYTPTYLISSQSVTSAMAHVTALTGMRNVFTDFPWYAKANAAEKTYHQALAKYASNYASGITASASSTQGWVSGQLFAAAAKAAKFTQIANPTSADVLKGLYALKKETLGGLAPPLTFTKGKAAGSVSCFFIGGLKNGTFYTPFGSKSFCL